MAKRKRANRNKKGHKGTTRSKKGAKRGNTEERTKRDNKYKTLTNT